jgi:peptide/nickel transport system permease protein
VLSPGVVRLVRTATLEVSVRGYVEAAVARGESTRAILFGEILPNIVRPVVADLGIRYGYSIILIASLNYLNLGIRPPTADWGLMTSENREVITTNPLAVLVPALLLGLLTVSVNLIGDAYARTLGRSEGRR